MKKKGMWWAGGIVLLSALLIGILSWVNGYFILAPAVQLELYGDAAMEIAAHSVYEEPGFLARKGRNDLRDLVATEGEVDASKPGVYTITYRLTMKGKEYTQQRVVTVVDREAPALELLGEAQLKISAKHLYEEAGYSAFDRCDGDLTEAVKVTEHMEGDILTLTYTVKDASGNEASVQRLITVRDEKAPTLQLRGYSTIYVPVGSTFRDPGCSATDDVDGDLSSAVICRGGVDTSAPGTYILTYCVTDKGGNSSEVARSVKVYSYTHNYNDCVYLTFDDGPSSYITGQVLDILAANDVQATFFILDYSQGNKHLISRMINEGHTVAIHGYSHDYATIYANDDAFMQNVYRLRDKLLADFGYNATILRFPGGSSNTVSAAYNSGIMSRLVQRVEQEGFSYFDWNVSSGDASAAGLSSYQIYDNVTSRLRRGRNNVVLMHDANAKQTTVDALQDIIHYGKANGYVFLPITPDTAPVHHGVAN